MLSREVSTLECVYHPFILRLFEVIETLGKIHLISEWVQGGELYNRITEVGPLKEPHAALLFQQLLLAVKHLHSLGFVHRDIKAENVLLVSEERIKLADFGFSTQLANGPWQHLDTFCGSPPYAAPELFSDDHYIGGPVDIWALGILLYFMLEGCMPFKAPTVPLLRTAVLKGEFVISTKLSVPCSRVIQRILVHTPSRRPTIEQLLECQWFKYAQEAARRNAQASESTANRQPVVAANRNAHVSRRRKKLFWFLPMRRGSSPESASSRDHISPPANNQRTRQLPHSQQRPMTVSSVTKSSASSRDDPRLAGAEIPNLRTIACSTKRAGSVLDESFLHPFKSDLSEAGNLVACDQQQQQQPPHHIKDVTNDVSNNNVISSSYNHHQGNGAETGAHPEVMQQAPANGHNREHCCEAVQPVSQERKPRRFSFGRTLKKRIGPMEPVSTAGSFAETQHHAREDLREKLERTIDEEHGKFVMYPTTAVSSEGNRHLHALEAETRRLMKVLGITSEMLNRAVANGPRSDIIGVYRIIMHRLQREQAQARLAAAAASSNSAFEFLELKSLTGSDSVGAASGGSSGRRANNGGGTAGALRTTAKSPRHIGPRNPGRTMCAIL
ncbi:sperm motility kinase-like isoform X2 [Anopheles albimanus]|nr:sperm motility kinase-like isoform X2 [Anopheles albimanus]XP_035780783.1 sperm motility kinase-like isoform X2 [Anopheles albimanus]